MTTREPGARLLFTQGLVSSPRSTAFLARSPAPIITDGFEVLVQLVIAAITTAPSCSEMSLPSSTPETTGGASGSTPGVPRLGPVLADGHAGAALADPAGVGALRQLLPRRGNGGAHEAGRFTMKFRLSSTSGTRSCGRRGPARLGVMVERSSSSVVLKTGSGVASVRKRPCSLQ